MRFITFIISMLFLGAYSAEAQHLDRGYSSSESSFVERGVWTVCGTGKYSQHINDDLNVSLVKSVSSSGYDISVNPKFLYHFRDDMGVGLSVAYDRSMLDVLSAQLSTPALTLGAEDCYQINHKFSAHGIYRAYIPLSGIKRVAMFSDVLLGGSFKQGKSFNASGVYADGTYSVSYTLEVSVDPGIVAFLTDRLALEMNLGIFGLSYNWTNQVHNQVDNGYRDSASAGFMFNLLSLGVGMSYYFL